MSTISKTEELNESNRYIGGDDKPINLAETTGHFKLKLTKVRKFSNIIDENNIQLNECEDKKITGVAQTKTKEEEKKADKADHKPANDCAINKDG